MDPDELEDEELEEIRYLTFTVLDRSLLTGIAVVTRISQL